MIAPTNTEIPNFLRVFGYPNHCGKDLRFKSVWVALIHQKSL
jgi:hypothetical protein